jgi:predicted transcriptional regulator of viral defense system
MSQKERFEIAKRDIVSLFESLNRKIFSRADIENIVADQRHFWRLSTTMSTKRFIEFMLERTKLQQIVLEFRYRTFVKYLWGEVSEYEVLSSLDARSYFTHYTAMYFHGLTEQIPKTIYLNIEQSPKYSRGELEQSRIDMAFRRPVRVSKNIAHYKDKKICLLNGMYTGELGVIEMEAPDGSPIRVTNIERTLIDIAVRPVYSGGIFEVLNAYRNAMGQCSINKLAAMLKKMELTYPYHQAIAFYLERAGYKESSIRLLRKFDMKYDFYLIHDMKETSYSKEWRLYFPKGF